MKGLYVYQNKKCVENIEKHSFKKYSYLWHYFILSNYYFKLFTSFIISVSIFMIYSFNLSYLLLLLYVKIGSSVFAIIYLGQYNLIYEDGDTL